MKLTKIFIFGLLVAILIPIKTVKAEIRTTADQDDLNLLQAFSSIRQLSIFPVIARNLNDINSAFGPRVKVADGNRYDWHRGIDTGENEGEQIVNAFEGKFEAIKEYPDGGTTVIVKHTFPLPLYFQGKTLPYFYTFYMHLSQVDSILVEAERNGQHPDLATGANIGLMGATGSTENNHLHFEIRVGTPCSLEYQLQNPQSTCAIGFGFDPHVNPLLLFSNISSSYNFVLSQSRTPEQNFLIVYTAPDESLYFNRVEYWLQDKLTGRKIKSHILNLNKREGFDASSTVALDTQDKTKPYIEPIIFGSGATEYKTSIIIPYSYWKSSRQTVSTIIVTDIWGNTKRLDWNN